MSEEEDISENQNTPLEAVDNKATLSKDSIDSKQPEVVGSKPQIKNIEVRHHSNLPHKKHLKEYFKEFVMIFLAVTLGFVAENIRENITEQRKAKEFAVSIISDLEEDQLWINSILDVRLWREEKLDTLSKMLGTPLLSNQYNDVYYYSRFLFKPVPFPTSDATFQELKSSGALRYFKNIKLQGQISKYYVFSSALKNENDLTMLEQEAYKLTSQILKDSYFSGTIGDEMGDIKKSVVRLNHSTTLLSTDPVLLNQLASLASIEKRNSSNFRGIASLGIQKNGIDLIASLKKEYDIK